MKRLRKLGLRVTPQRIAIFDLLQGDSTHPSAEEMYRRLSRKYPGMSFATVYNTLSKLVRAGEIQELDIDPDRKRFDPCARRHYHFYCRVCGRVYDVEYDFSLPSNMKKMGGHLVEAVQLNFKGVCKICAGKSQALKIRRRKNSRQKRLTGEGGT